MPHWDSLTDANHSRLCLTTTHVETPTSPHTHKSTSQTLPTSNCAGLSTFQLVQPVLRIGLSPRFRACLQTGSEHPAQVQIQRAWSKRLGSTSTFGFRLSSSYDYDSKRHTSTAEYYHTSTTEITIWYITCTIMVPHAHKCSPVAKMPPVITGYYIITKFPCEI
jgi:hypothetical protein